MAMLPKVEMHSFGIKYRRGSGAGLFMLKLSDLFLQNTLGLSFNSTTILALLFNELDLPVRSPERIVSVCIHKTEIRDEK